MGTGYLNPADGEVYPFYELQFNMPVGAGTVGVQLIMKVATPNLAGGGGAADQTALESVLADIATAMAGFASVDSGTIYVQRYDATATVLDSD
jgi:hypothetical protein